MSWLMNRWYAAAWSSEIGAEPFGRTLLDLPVVLFRDAAGVLAAIGGRCPHRFAPLALGKVVGDALQCPYHGLRFGASGACVLNPQGGRIPPLARVPAYPAVERHGLAWLWPGDADRADPGLIPDLSHLEREDLGHVRGSMGLDAHYLLGIDNLIDLSHAQFVHGDRLASDAFAAAKVGVEHVGETIVSRFSIAGSDVPEAMRGLLPADVDRVDYWLDSTWHPASTVVTHVGIGLPGRPREEGQRSFGVHLVTPATRHGSHYLYAHSRNYSVRDPAVDARIREWQRVGFGQQDKPIVEATARMMGDEVDPLAMRPVLLASDAGAVQVRRRLAKLIAAEQDAAAASAPAEAKP